MPSSVTINVIKGEKAGESFTYTEKESLILGRANDCGIVLPDETVSRYHCMVEILPPAANFRDFGSGNGIKLNGKTVVPGRFKTGQSLEEARENEIIEFSLKEGDVIALSSKCELSIGVFVPEYCAECLEELVENEEGQYQNDDGEIICPDCFMMHEIEKEEARQEEEKRERIAAEEQLEIQKAEEQRIKDLKDKEKQIEIEKNNKAQAEADEKAAMAKLRRDAIREIKEEKNKCTICGNNLPSGRAADDARICPECMANPMALLDHMLRMAVGGNEDLSNIKGFRTIEELGRGGQGAVFKVEEEATGEIYALKLLLANKNATALTKARFLREASIGEQLKHPNIVEHYRYGQCGDVYYVLQEVCNGGSLDKLIEKHHGVLHEDIATNAILQILDALTYAHKQEIEVDLADGTVQKKNGIVHRDIKPGNFFLANQYKNGPFVVKLADFGMAKAFEAAGLTNFTRTGEAGGTPVFMPRQQIINYKYAKPDVDVWGVAASYYQMLTGLPPKEFNLKKDVWSQALKNPAVPIRKRNSSIDKKLAEVIDHALIEKPEIGFSTALEFKKAIEGAI